MIRRDSTPREGATSSSIRHVACDVLDDVDCPEAPIKVILEFGTFPIGQIVNNHRADTWLKFHGDLHTPLGRRIKAELRNALFCDDPEWLEAVWRQGESGTRAVLDELSGTSTATAD